MGIDLKGSDSIDYVKYKLQSTSFADVHSERNQRISCTDRLSLSAGWENGPEQGLKTVSLTLNFL